MMELTSEQLTALKNKELEILKEFISVCRKLKLKYFMAEGTLLGTVRHGGFIPWDDDIDVSMPRKDYEVFIREGQKYLPKHLRIQSIYTEPAYLLNFSKIRNIDTTFVEIGSEDLPITHGVYIDIFPLDAPVEAGRQKVYKVKKWICDFRIYMELDKGKNKKLRTIITEIISKMLFSTPNKAMRAREALYKSGLDWGFVTVFSSAYGDKETVPSKWYGEGKKLTFEGIEVTVPDEYDKVLTHIYGDYMKLPPENERIPHHFVAKFDMDTPYNEWV